MKYLFFLLILISNNLYSQGTKDYSARITEESERKIKIEIKLLNYKIEKNDELNKLKIRGTQNTITSGDPLLPFIAEAICLPEDSENIKVEILESEKKILKNITLDVSAGNRKYSSKKEKIQLSERRTENIFFPEKRVSVSDIFYFRNKKGVSVHFFPATYNAVKKELKICEKVEITIKFSRSIKYAKKNTKSDTHFNSLYKNTFLNFKESKKKTKSIPETAGMLIIAPKRYHIALQNFINWKKQIGIDIFIEDADLFQNAEQIQNKVAEYYIREDISYLLLVGDNEDVPTLRKDLTSVDKNVACDPAYGFITENDAFPEVLVGRLSVLSYADLFNQLNKIIEYEKAEFKTNDWLEKFLLIASNEGPGDNNEYDHEHMRKIRYKLQDYGYTEGNEMYDGSQGELDLAGNPNNTMVREAINAGRGILCYIGHGTSKSINTSGFNITDIHSLNNSQKHPFLIMVACNNGDFAGKTCAAEAWLRATDNNDKPTGAVAVLASSIEQDWSPPMLAQDEMINIITKQTTNYIAHNFGQIIAYGCAKMNIFYPLIGKNNASCWTLFGDPSMMIRTKKPQIIKAEHKDEIVIGENYFAVKLSVPFATGTLTKDNVTIKNIAIDGNLMFPLNPNIREGIYKLTITAPEHKPYVKGIEVKEATKAFIHIKNLSYNLDESAQIKAGEEQDLAVEIKNTGRVEANQLRFELKAENNYTKLIKAEAEVENIAQGENLKIEKFFRVKCSPKVTNKTPLKYKILIYENNSLLSEQFFILNAKSARIKTNYIKIKEKEGNMDGKIQTTEKHKIEISISNISNTYINDAIILLETENPYISIRNKNTKKNLPTGATQIYTFELIVASLAPTHSPLLLSAKIKSPVLETKIHEKLFYINPQIEEWNSGTADYKWTFSGTDWQIIEDNNFSSNYCVRSGNITNNKKSSMTININTLRDDSISFFCKVSSEEGFDYLSFYDNDEIVRQWSGKHNWKKYTYFLSEGKHKLSWSYEKDYYGSEGEDAAFIANIEFPCHKAENENNLPIFESQPLTSATIQKIYSYNISYYDKDEEDKLSIMAIKIPEWLALISQTKNKALLKGIPTTKGKEKVIIGLNDGKGEIVTQEFFIDIQLNSIYPKEPYKQLKIYPNPSDDLLIINKKAQTDAEIKITDINGKIMLQTTQRAGKEIQIIKPSLPSGFYIINWQSKKEKCSAVWLKK